MNFPTGNKFLSVMKVDGNTLIALADIRTAVHINGGDFYTLRQLKAILKVVRLRAGKVKTFVATDRGIMIEDKFLELTQDEFELFEVQIEKTIRGVFDRSYEKA